MNMMSVELKDKFKIKLIQHLYGKEEWTISDLSKKIRKSIPFTTSLINEMVEEGIVEEGELAQSRGGRRPQLFRVRKDIFYVVGVAVDQLKSKFVVYDLHGNQVGEVRSKNIVLTRDGKDLPQLGKFISRGLAQCGIPREKILGIGISMPGFVDVKAGKNHTFLHAGDSIVEYLESVLYLPVFIDNDSSLVGLAEYRHGLAKGHKNALVINIGWGVGLGIIISQEVFRGENGFAGEFSHIPLFVNNKICSCGKVGCLETETSLYVLLEKAKEGLSSGVHTSLPATLPEDRTAAVQKIFEGMEQGDTFAISLLKHLGQNLGRGISILIHLFNPGLIVLSGKGSVAGRYWLPPVQQAINEHSISKLAEGIEMEISELGPDSELLGAATLVIARLDEILEKDHINTKLVNK